MAKARKTVLDKAIRLAKAKIAKFTREKKAAAAAKKKKTLLASLKKKISGLGKVRKK